MAVYQWGGAMYRILEYTSPFRVAYFPAARDIDENAARKPTTDWPKNTIGDSHARMHSSFVRSCLVSFSLAVISWLVKIYRLFENCVFHPVRCYPLFFSVLFYRLSARTDLERRDKSPDRKTFRNVVSSFIRRSGAKYVVKLTNCADVLMRIFLRRSFTLRRIGALYLSRRHSSILCSMLPF